MKRRKFKLWHSLIGTAVFLAIEGVLLAWLGPLSGLSIPTLLIFAVVGTAANIYIATEAIEEVRGTLYLLALLSIVVLEFVIFFAFQYWYVLVLQPASFPTLTTDPATLLLHSLMVFVFNPLYLPATAAGRILLIINTFGALGLVMFILQNIWQFRGKTR